MGKRNLISLFAIALITITVILTMLNKNMWRNENSVIFWDVKSYYAYLPALVIHGDPHFNFVEKYPDTYGDKFWLEVADNGNNLIITSMGMSMLYLPFFLMGHATALIASFEATGYTYPYFAFMLLGSVFYLTLGLWFLRKLLLNYFHDGVVAATLFIIFFGTNLLWYSTFEATMSHAYSFALFAAFAWFTKQWHAKPCWRYSILTGLIFGLITVVRPSNAVIALFFVFFSISKAGEIIPKISFFLRNSKYLIVLVITAIIVLVPQLIYWKYITGLWIVNSYGDKGIFHFDNPQIFNGLFGYRKGLFVYAPVILVAFLSLPALLKDNKASKYFMPIIVFSCVNIYIILSWWAWWYGGSFGLRPLIESYALLAIPMAAGISYLWARRNLIRIPALSVVFLLTSYGLFANIQYYYGAIHWDSMTKEAFWDSFGRLKPSANFQNLISPPDYEYALAGKPERNKHQRSGVFSGENWQEKSDVTSRNIVVGDNLEFFELYNATHNHIGQNPILEVKLFADNKNDIPHDLLLAFTISDSLNNIQFYRDIKVRAGMIEIDGTDLLTWTLPIDHSMSAKSNVKLFFWSQGLKGFTADSVFVGLPDFH